VCDYPCKSGTNISEAWFVGSRYVRCSQRALTPEKLDAPNLAAHARNVLSASHDSKYAQSDVVHHRSILSHVVGSLDLAAFAGTTNDADTLRQEANGFFKSGDFNAARDGYTAALASHMLVKDIAAIMCNLAHCALMLNKFHDAVAYARACMCLKTPLMPKAGYRLARGLCLLGEHDICLSMIASLLIGLEDASDQYKKDLYQMKKNVERGSSLSQKGYSIDDVAEAACTNGLSDTAAVEWVGPITSSHIPGKGRGVVAVLANRCVISRANDEAASRTFVRNLNTNTRMCDDESMRLLKAYAVEAAPHDVELSWRICQLHDGSTQLDLVPIEELLSRLSSRVLPLLGQHSDYYCNSHNVDPDKYRIESVIDLNSHDGRRHGTVAGQTSTSLFPAISMFNHDDAPNCMLGPLCATIESHVVVACRDIEEGEELTLKYSTEEAVRNKWLKV